MKDTTVSVSHDKEFNLDSVEMVSNVYMRVYTSLFTSGLVAKLGASRFTTLMAIASYMDAEGECSPTQLQIAEAIGVHKNSVSRFVTELLEFTVNGKPLVVRKIINRGQGNIYSYYRIHPISQLAKFDRDGQELIEQKSIEVVHKEPVAEVTIANGGDAVKYFQQIYREVYSVNYNVSSWARDGKTMKDNVLTPYPEMAKEIIEQTVRLYGANFARGKYPRPTIAMFSWLPNQIIPMIEEEKKLTAIAEQSDAIEAEAEQRLEEKMAKLGQGN